MSEDPGHPVAPTPPDPPRGKGSLTTFVGGVILGFLVAVFPAVLIGVTAGGTAAFNSYSSGSGSKHTATLACVVEVAGCALLLYFASRRRRGSLFAGVLVGGSVAFLLCAACWGMVTFS